MEQKDKELLLIDLCARLPYKVKVYNTTFKEPTIQTLYGKISEDEFLMEEAYTSVGVDGDDFGFFNKRHYSGYIDFIKPYLRPMSSMTEEEFFEYHNIKYSKITYRNNWKRIDVGKFHNVGIIPIEEYLDWLNVHHFDYRGLIEKGLALEAPEGMCK